MKNRIERPAFFQTSLVSSILWIASIHCLVLQFVLQAFWTQPFSLNFNTISDLGAVSCGVVLRHGSSVCSPMHGAMDASFIAFGAMWVLGAIGLSRAGKFPFDRRLITVPLVIGGLGAVVVGTFPEDGLSLAHSAGAALEMFGGAVGFIGVGVRLLRSGSEKLGAASVFLGVLSVTAFALFLLTFENQSVLLGLGLGGWERIAFWSENLWLLGAGAWTLRQASR